MEALDDRRHGDLISSVHGPRREGNMIGQKGMVHTKGKHSFESCIYLSHWLSSTPRKEKR
jgi:hypothetical protein